MIGAGTRFFVGIADKVLRRRTPERDVDRFLEELSARPRTIACNYCPSPFEWMVERNDPKLRQLLVEHLKDFHEEWYR
ncbi:hypothetical protein SEA_REDWATTLEHOG_106 [Gordonia phage RedWattleHog]|nr:hypothetical protein SEA_REDWATTLEHOG_106 [Gordonia phage RedWattleHog]